MSNNLNFTAVFGENGFYGFGLVGFEAVQADFYSIKYKWKLILFFYLQRSSCPYRLLQPLYRQALRHVLFQFRYLHFQTGYFVFFGGGAVDEEDVGSLSKLLNELTTQTIYRFLVVLEFGVLGEACHADHNLPTRRTHLLNKIGANFKLNLFHYNISKYSIHHFVPSSFPPHFKQSLLLITHLPPNLLSIPSSFTPFSLNFRSFSSKCEHN